MPMLAADRTPRRPWSCERLCRAPSTRSATAIASCGVGDVLAQDRELVAAEAGHRLVAADSAWRSRSATASEQLVAGRVAEAVVDDLEAVEVDEQHGDAAAAAARMRSSALAGGPEQQAVRQAGQRVAQELLLVRAPGLDVRALAASTKPPWIIAHLNGCAIASGGRRPQRLRGPEHAVVQDDEADREPERQPVLVQREDADHHEEVEVHLDDAAPEVDEHRRGRDEAGARGDHPPAQRDARQHRDDRERDHRADVEEDVPSP